MKRAIALLLVVALAVAAALAVGRGGDTTGIEAAKEVERRLREGDLAGAQRAARDARGRVPDWRAAYLDALVHLGAGRIPEASAAAEAAYGVPEARDDWRVLSVVYSTRLASRRPASAWEALETYVREHPDDERGLFEAARYWSQIRQDAPDPDRAVAWLDRIDALPVRAAPPDDPTAVPADRVAEVRAAAAGLRELRGTAVAAARSRVDAAPGDADAWAGLGEALRLAGKPFEAAEAYRKAVALAPDRTVFAKQLVLLLLEPEVEGPPPEIDRLTARLLDEAPGAPDVRILRARSEVRNDRIPEAIEVYRGLRGDPSLTPRQRLEVTRNLAVALYDWKGPGRDYRDEAHTLLKEYRDLGGEIDAALRDPWEKLEARARERGGSK